MDWDSTTRSEALMRVSCIRHDLTMLTTDKDFGGIANHSTLALWNVL